MDHDELLHADVSGSVIAAFYEVYNNLLYYKVHRLCTYKLDMLVDDKVVIEIKSTAELPKTAMRQLHNYLHATDYEVGLLLHFGPEAKFYRQCVLNKSKGRISVSDR